MHAASRLGALATLGLHAAVLAALVAYQPTRSALLRAAPIMVDWIAAPRPEPKVEPPTEPPRPRPVKKAPAERHVLAAAPEAPVPAVVPAPPPPPPPAPVAAAPAEIPVTAPVFNASYLDNPAPAYPPMSRRLREQGKVVLRVLVNAAGGADDVQVRASSGFPRLDDTARETVRRWRFVPAKRGPQAVPAWVLIPISFKLEG